MDKAIENLRQEVIYKLCGKDVHVEIAPCSFMYPNYGLQLMLKLKQDGKLISSDTLINKQVTPATATAADVDKMLETVSFQACPCCGTPTFSTHEKFDNRHGKCEPCFMKQLDAEFAEAEAKEMLKFKKHCAKMKAQGFKYMVDIVVHSNRGSDKVVTYFMADMPADMNKFAKQKHPRAAALDIGTVTAL
jgi:hypothetical protein